MGGLILGILIFILHGFGAFYCATKADQKNRKPALWAIFGFIFPIITIIAVVSVGNGTIWHTEKD